MATTHKRKWEVNWHKVCAGLLLACGLLMLASTTTVNYLQGVTLGAGDAQQKIYGAMSVLVDVVGIAVLAFYIGYLRRKGERTAGLSFLVCGFMVYSWVMFYGFGAANRVAPTLMAEAKHVAEVEAYNLTKANAIAQQDKHVAFLQGQVQSQASLATNRNLPRSVRADARASQQTVLDAAGQATFGTTVVFKAAPVAEITDPQSFVIAQDIGWKQETVQKMLTGVLGLLFIIAKALLFGYAGKEWGRARASSDVLPAVVEVKEDEVEADEVKEIVRTEPAVAPLAVVDFAYDEDDERDEDVRQLGLELTSEIATHCHKQTQVLEFIENACDVAPGTATQASELFQAYEDWARGKGYYPRLTFMQFGRAMTMLIKSEQIKVARHNNKKLNFYIGVTPTVDSYAAAA